MILYDLLPKMLAFVLKCTFFFLLEFVFPFPAEQDSWLLCFVQFSRLKTFEKRSESVSWNTSITLSELGFADLLILDSLQKNRPLLQENQAQSFSKLDSYFGEPENTLATYLSDLNQTVNRSD